MTDSNYAIRFYYFRFTRVLRDKVKPHLYDLWIASVDVTNSTAKITLGILGSLFKVLSDICFTNQKKWN